jgi:hypothetical protein
MEKIGNRIKHTLICSKDLLQYLEIEDKTELSSTCKFIYNKCKVIRLEKHHFGILEVQELAGIANKRSLTTADLISANLGYLNYTVDKYKLYIDSYSYSGHYYNLAEYFTSKFINVSYLCLDTLTIPKLSLKHIIENLSYLQSLTLDNIMLSYPKSDHELIQFKFPKRLQKLKWINCFQLQSDSIDPVLLNRQRRSIKYDDYYTMDINISSINTLKSLYWRNSTGNHTQLLSEILSNNSELNSLKLHFYGRTPIPFLDISNCTNLSKLILSDVEFSRFFNIEKSMKLPYIKVLDIQSSSLENIELIDILIHNCSNLVELKYYSFLGCEDYLVKYNNVLSKLKSFYINASYYVPSFQIPALSVSILESLEIRSRYPIEFNFNIFKNMKLLKMIKNTRSTEYMSSWSKAPNYKELNGWRMIKYPNSILYWKV